MSLPNEPVDRERLAADPELGTLLRRANLEYRAGLDEPGAFQRVSALTDRAGRARPRAQVATALGLLCAAAAGWLVWLEAGRGTAPEVLLGPEVSVGESVPALGAEPTPHAPARDGQAPTAERVRESVEDPAPENEPRAAVSRDALGPTDSEAQRRGETRDREAVERRTRELPRSALESDAEPVRKPARGAEPERAVRSGPGAAAAAPERGLGSGREDCLELARHGDPRAAERCFDQRAAGSGLGAEMALYEMARLRRDVLSDAVGALAALSAYRERFERGSLRNEVDLSRIELLAELGRSADALRESAALLASASGRERAAELHSLRGDIYSRSVGDLRAAAAEYAQVEAFGGSRGAEASRRLGACLEALGDVSGAIAAYRRYVSDPERPSAAEVRARIERLAGASARAGSAQ